MNKTIKANIFARDDFEKHPILNQISDNFNASCDTKVSVSLRNIHTVIATKTTPEEIFTDPISFVIRYFFIKFQKKQNYKTIFFSLEMFEYQVVNITLKQKIRNLIYKMCHRFTLKRADTVFFPNKLRQEFYIRQIPNLQRRSKILPNYPDRKSLNALTKEVSSKEVVDIITEMGCKAPVDLESKKIFIYAGALRNDAEGLISLISKISMDPVNIILICSKLTKEHDFLKTLPNVLCLGYIERSKALRLISYSHVGLAYYGKKPLNVCYAAPVKIYEYLAASLEVFCNKNQGVQTLSDSNIHYYDEKGNFEFYSLSDLKLQRKTRSHNNIPAFDLALSEVLQR